MKKVVPEKYIFFIDAIAFFKTNEDFLRALQYGDVKAFGNPWDDGTHEKSLLPLEEIPKEFWLSSAEDWEVCIKEDRNNISLYLGDDNNGYHIHAYKDIKLDKEEFQLYLDAHKEPSIFECPKPKNASHLEWDNFQKALVLFDTLCIENGMLNEGRLSISKTDVAYIFKEAGILSAEESTISRNYISEHSYFDKKFKTGPQTQTTAPDLKGVIACLKNHHKSS